MILPVCARISPHRQIQALRCGGRRKVLILILSRGNFIISEKRLFFTVDINSNKLSSPLLLSTCTRLFVSTAPIAQKQKKALLLFAAVCSSRIHRASIMALYFRLNTFRVERDVSLIFMCHNCWLHRTVKITILSINLFRLGILWAFSCFRHCAFYLCQAALIYDEQIPRLEKP